MKERNLYLYFSGTGNTRYVLEKFASIYEDVDYNFISIEDKFVDFKTLIKNADTIIIGHPIHESIMPFIMQDFLKEHSAEFSNKKIITIVTQMYFSGDGGALAYRILRKSNTKLLHSIHINMPNNITDVKLLRPKKTVDTVHIIEKADKKITDIVSKIKSGVKIKMGMRFYSRTLGFFTQRSYGYYFYNRLRKKLIIHHDKCIKCNKCIEVCPVNNLEMVDNKVLTSKICTVCYRCVNICPTQAISLFSKKIPKVQYIREKYN